MTILRMILVCLVVLIAACRRPSKQLGALLTPASQVEITDYSRSLKAGDELLAVGHEPSWSLIINSSKNYLRFKALNGDSVNVAVPEQINDSNGGFRYTATTGTGQLTAFFKADSCLDKLSGQHFDYHVEVSLHGKNYVGCGTSLRQLALLQDSWVLTELQGNPVVAPALGRERPRLDISLTEGRVTGTTGCNRLSGRVRADSRLIEFGPLATTRMACPGDTTNTEATFLNVLNQPIAYRVGDGKLTLLQKDKPVAVFKKVD